MPRVEAYENNDGQAQVGAANLLSMIGQAKGVTGGWSGFALKSILVSTSAATVSCAGGCCTRACGSKPCHFTALTAGYLSPPAGLGACILDAVPRCV